MCFKTGFKKQAVWRPAKHETRSSVSTTAKSTSPLSFNFDLKKQPETNSSSSRPERDLDGDVWCGAVRFSGVLTVDLSQLQTSGRGSELNHHRSLALNRAPLKWFFFGGGGSASLRLPTRPPRVRKCMDGTDMTEILIPTNWDIVDSLMWEFRQVDMQNSFLSCGCVKKEKEKKYML